jgi:hypothetical protein
MMRVRFSVHHVADIDYDDLVDKYRADLERDGIDLTKPERVLERLWEEGAFQQPHHINVQEEEVTVDILKGDDEPD